MKCHYCDRDAAYAAEKDGESLADSEKLAAIREQIDIDRTE
jgi:hypothetical protein